MDNSNLSQKNQQHHPSQYRSQNIRQQSQCSVIRPYTKFKGNNFNTQPKNQSVHHNRRGEHHSNRLNHKKTDQSQEFPLPYSPDPFYSIPDFPVDLIKHLSHGAESRINNYQGHHQHKEQKQSYSMAEQGRTRGIKHPLNH